MGIAIARICLSAALALTLPGVVFAQVTVPAGGTINIPPGGNMNLGCNALNVQGNLNVTSGQVSSSGNVTIANSGILNGGQGTVTVSGNWSNSGSFVPGTGAVVFTDGCTTAPITISGTTTFNNLTLSSNSGTNFVVPAGSNITVNGILTLQGTPSQPIQLSSSNPGQTAIINLGPQAQVVRNNVNVNGNVQIGALPAAIPTLSEYGLMLMALLMAGTALWRGRQGPWRTASAATQASAATPTTRK